MQSSLADIRVMLATDRFVVIDKPAGVLSVPGKGEANKACAASWAQEQFPRATGPIVVHRLDMDTSGLLILALDGDAQRDLSKQFEVRSVEKAYVALVEGRVTAERGTIDIPIRPDLENRPYQIIDREHGRAATTAWRVHAYETDRTRLELTPLTGRTHQLRVHCAFGGPGGLRGSSVHPEGRGHPILGDMLYGDGASADRLMLHACRLVFTDPGTGRRVEVESRPSF